MAFDIDVNHYPIIINLQEQLVVVVGGGSVGCGKTRRLLQSGAKVRLVTLGKLADPTIKACVELRTKPFAEEDLSGARLAIAATGDNTIDQAVLKAGRRLGIWVNVASDGAAGDFHLPAVLHRGNFLLAVATSGHAPGLSRVLRDRLAREFGPEWDMVVKICAAWRSRSLTEGHQDSYICKVLDNFLSEGLPELIVHGQTEAVNQLMTRVTGQEVRLSDLGLALRDESP